MIFLFVLIFSRLLTSTGGLVLAENTCEGMPSIKNFVYIWYFARFMRSSGRMSSSFSRAGAGLLHLHVRLEMWRVYRRFKILPRTSCSSVRYIDLPSWDWACTLRAWRNSGKAGCREILKFIDVEIKSLRSFRGYRHDSWHQSEISSWEHGAEHIARIFTDETFWEIHDDDFPYPSPTWDQMNSSVERPYFGPYNHWGIAPLYWENRCDCFLCICFGVHALNSSIQNFWERVLYFFTIFLGSLYCISFVISSIVLPALSNGGRYFWGCIPDEAPAIPQTFFSLTKPQRRRERVHDWHFQRKIESYRYFTSPGLKRMTSLFFGNEIEDFVREISWIDDTDTTPLAISSKIIFSRRVDLLHTGLYRWHRSVCVGQLWTWSEFSCHITKIQRPIEWLLRARLRREEIVRRFKFCSSSSWYLVSS